MAISTLSCVYILKFIRKQWHGPISCFIQLFALKDAQGGTAVVPSWP